MRPDGGWEGTPTAAPGREPAGHGEPAAGDEPRGGGEPAVAEPLADGPVTITLHAPVPAHGEDQTTLTFRPMTPEDVCRVGYPLRVLRDGSTLPNAAIIAALIARLAGVPESTVARLHMHDYQRATEVVLGFFAGSDPSA